MRFRLSQAVRATYEMGVVGQELFAFVFSVKSLSPYLLGKFFTVRMDHKILIYLSNSNVPKLVRWRVLISDVRFQIEYIRP